MPLTLWWIRRDLRLYDNPALRVALAGGRSVLPVFVLDPVLLAAVSPLKRAFLFAGLKVLDGDLRARGSRLLVRAGNPAEALAGLMTESGADLITAEEDYSAYARRRDDLAAQRLPLQWVPGATIHHPAAVRRSGGKPYTVFTPYCKAWKALPFAGRELFTPPDRFPPAPELGSLPLPEPEITPGFPAGEAEAHRRLEEFIAGPIADYEADRNRLDLEGTSGLSPYLHLGMLSARQAALATRQAIEQAHSAQVRRGAETWLSELIWREFYYAILYEYPHVTREAFNPAFKAVPWRNDPQGLYAWEDGITGFPVVDAGMRQLAQTGWMHNRARMITASFLVKDLLIDWRAGERFFMRHLIDGDPAANNGGWQWVAGTGTDAAPYFRVFNPALQGKKFDPEGTYVRRWVPELAHVPRAFIHEPWKMPPDVQREAGCRLGKDYPAPRVEHASARMRALSAYRIARVSGEAQEDLKNLREEETK